MDRHLTRRIAALAFAALLALATVGSALADGSWERSSAPPTPHPKSEAAAAIVADALAR